MADNTNLSVKAAANNRTKRVGDVNADFAACSVALAEALYRANQKQKKKKTQRTRKQKGESNNTPRPRPKQSKAKEKKGKERKAKQNNTRPN